MRADLRICSDIARLPSKEISDRPTLNIKDYTYLSGPVSRMDNRVRQSPKDRHHVRLKSMPTCKHVELPPNKRRSI